MGKEAKFTTKTANFMGIVKRKFSVYGKGIFVQIQIEIRKSKVAINRYVVFENQNGFSFFCV